MEGARLSPLLAWAIAGALGFVVYVAVRYIATGDCGCGQRKPRLASVLGR